MAIQQNTMKGLERLGDSFATLKGNYLSKENIEILLYVILFDQKKFIIYLKICNMKLGVNVHN